MSRLPLWKVFGVPTRCVLGLGLIPWAALGCVDAKGDYEEYLSRPYVPREAGMADVAQSPCQEVLAQNLDGKYFGTCLPKVVGSPFSLSIDQKVRPSADGTTGELDITFSALTLTATSMSDIAGNPNILMTVPIDADCRYRQDVGTLILPAAANSFNRDLESVDVVLRGKLLTAERSCAELDGKVPFAGLSLDADGDVCVYVRAPADGSLPMVPMDEYVCDPSILLPR